MYYTLLLMSVITAVLPLKVTVQSLVKDSSKQNNVLT